MVIFFFCKNHWHQWFFDGFWVAQPSPFNNFQPQDHCFQWVFDGFGVIQPLVSMVFNGHGPLVQRCDGFNISLTSGCGSLSLEVKFVFQKSTFSTFLSSSSSHKRKRP